MGEAILKKPLNIAVLGSGFMGRAHANAYKQVGQFFESGYQPVLKVCYGREENRGNLEAFASRWGFGSFDTNWQRIIEREDIDLIDVCLPNHMHYDVVMAAAAAGKMIACEKPLAMNVAEAQEMSEAVCRAGVASLVWYNYRRVPAIALAKQIIDEGRVGKAFHYRATYNQDYTISGDIPQGGRGLWRLDSKIAGSGVTGDLLAHSIDTAEWLNGPIRQVVAKTETFVKKRLHQDSGKIQLVDIDDACMFLAEFENGSIGTFESTRYARGRKNYKTFELNGENGALHFDLEDPHILEFFRYADPETGEKCEDHLTGWQRIHVSNAEHPYMDKWWVPGTTIGYEHTFINTLADFLAGLESGVPAEPTIRSGLRTQIVCDAVLESARNKGWVEIS